VTAETKPAELHFTGDPEADGLIAREPLALLIGFALDQQIPVPRAFSAPLELQRRIGPLDAGRIARLDPAELDEAFRRKPALHRFPGAMAERVQALCAVVHEEYGGDAARLWEGAADGSELRRRIASLPGFGEMKVKALGSVLAKRFGVASAESLVPDHPTLGDVDSPEALDAYQAKKRAYKAKRRAEQSVRSPGA
jgi:uncharacterized HhH-GPD family protein